MPEMPEQTSVATPSMAYTKHEEMRLVCRHLMGGLPEIVKHAAVYLPREPMERIAEVPVTPETPTGRIDPWKLRVNRARLEPAFQDAVDSLVGKVFAKPPKLSPETPKDFEDFAADVDAQGNNLAVFALTRCTTSIAEGISFVLVDYPDAPDDPTRTVEGDKLAGFRPFWRAYSPGAVIAWETEVRRGQVRLRAVRLKECVMEKVDEWGSIEREQIRVFYAGDPDKAEDYVRWEVYRADENGNWNITGGGLRKPHVDIPLAAIPTDETEMFCACPPLLDLAYLNIAHLRKASDLDNAQHLVGFPFLSWSGISAKDAIEQLSGGLAANRFLVSPAPGGAAGFVEPAGSSWAAIEKTMETIMKRMEKLAGDPLLESAPGNLTATGEAIRAAKASAKLLSWVSRWEDAFSKLFYFTAIDLGLVKPSAETGWGGVTFHKVFIPQQQNTEGVRILHERNMAGKLSDETTFGAIRAAELVPEDLTYEEEAERLAQQAPALGMVGKDAAFARKVLALVRQGMGEEDAIRMVEDGEEPAMPPPAMPMPPAGSTEPAA